MKIDARQSGIRWAVLLFGAITVALVASFLRLDRVAPSVSGQNPRYRFFLVAPDSTDPFWGEVERGARDAARKSRSSLEFNAPEADGDPGAAGFLDMAVLSGADGILTHVGDPGAFSGIIAGAAAKGIPVVTVDNDLPGSKRTSFVGSGGYRMGEAAGRLMAKATGGKARVAIVTDGDGADGAVYRSLRISGFLDGISRYPGMSVSGTYGSVLGTLSAARITHSLLTGPDRPDAVYAMGSEDTVGVAQAVVDLNMVGRVGIVGFGDTPAIKDWIKKGVVSGTVTGDAYRMGYEGVMALVMAREGKPVSSYIGTGIRILETGEGVALDG